ncbi:MAG TPA: BON domain-containing protein [Pirellulaceae bacterium]|nr:BON domain-containing protein [Pirellulaceae bacterium]
MLLAPESSRKTHGRSVSVLDWPRKTQLRHGKPRRRQDVDDSLDQRVLSEFQNALEKDTHFCGRRELIRVRVRRGVLRLSGVLPTYFLKQLVQCIARRVRGIKRIVNRIGVFEPADAQALSAIWRERIHPNN